MWRTALICFAILWYPLFSFTLVIGNSMDHGEDFWREEGFWYEKNNISKEEFSSWPLQRGISSGNLLVTIPATNLAKGDVILFESRGHLVVHRIISEHPLRTKGDNNSYILALERSINASQVISEVVLVLP